MVPSSRWPPHVLLLLVVACTAGDRSGTGGDTGVMVDCPTPSTWYVDGDGDGFGSGAAMGQSCVRPDGQVANDQDCDDGNGAVNPFAIETCNGFDDNCDGVVDPSDAEGVVQCFQDADSDGFGDASQTQTVCACEDGWVLDDTDCDDTDPTAFPGATEVLYDGVDQDCLGLTGEYDRDGDGYDWSGGKGVDGRDCDDDDAAINPDALDLCDDDVDQDCDGRLDECGFDLVNTPADAWLTVYRDNTEPTNSGWFGNNIVFAGDGDGDGKNELLAAEVHNTEDLSASRYLLIEPPAGTSGGSMLLDDVVIASWNFEYGKGQTAAHHIAQPLATANIDLDGDGSLDYLFSTGDNTPDGPFNGMALTYGPVSGEVDLESTQWVYSDDSILVNMSPQIVVPPDASGGGWTVAAPLWPTQDADEGTVHQGILLLGPDDFSESTDASLVPSIWTSEGMEMRGVNIAEDIDGDGVRDLVTATHYYLGDFPTGRVLTFLGPIDALTMADSTFSDADIILETDQQESSFGITVAVLGDHDGDGHRTVMVGHPSLGRTGLDSVRFFEPSTAPPGSRLDENFAYARLDAGSVTRPSWFAGSAVGDIDLDGQDEIAIPVSAQSDGAEADRVYLYEAPTAGVASLDDYEAELRSDEDIDKYAGFGSALIAGHDLDGDGSPDLLVGEYYWDADPDQYYAPYGRVMIFRGEVE